MPGNLLTKDAATIVVANANLGALTSASAGACSTVDVDARDGNAHEGYQWVRAELVVQWVTITGITKDKTIAELYLVPKLDGTNAPDIDTTAGSSALPYGGFAAVFTCVKAPVTNTNMRFITDPFELMPELATVYILNRSGQTYTANGTVKLFPAHGQYT